MIFISLSQFILLPILAQQTVTGKITDDRNAPLPGVSIQVRNTLSGTFSDIDGNFLLIASPTDTLDLSMVGMVSQAVPVGERNNISIKLLTATTQLEDVIVIGYGTQRVRDLTAPITSVKGEKLTKQLTSNVMQALQGQVAGVQIINSGVPGSGATVKIRGVGSIGDYANPLYVVDGVFVDISIF